MCSGIRIELAGQLFGYQIYLHNRYRTFCWKCFFVTQSLLEVQISSILTITHLVCRPPHAIQSTWNCFDTAKFNRVTYREIVTELSETRSASTMKETGRDKQRYFGWKENKTEIFVSSRAFSTRTIIFYRLSSEYSVGIVIKCNNRLPDNQVL